MRTNVEEKELKTGDILICSTNRLLGKLIKKVSKSKFSHTANVVKCYGEVLIVEAQRRGVEIVDFNQWKVRYNYTYLVARPNREVLKDTTYFARRAFSKTRGKKSNYDVKALFWDFPKYILTGTWVGPKNQDEALIEGKFNCSTITGWLHKFKKWWMLSPQNVYEECKKSEDFKFL